MKNWIRTILTVCIVLLAFVWSAGVSDFLPAAPSTVVAQAAGVSLNTYSKRLIKGKSFTLKVKGTNKKVTWKSANKKIATVDANGVVTAKKKGETTITAKVGGYTYTCYVYVETPKISNKTLTVIQGESASLSMKGTYQKVKWSSSDKKVATVSEYGYVKAIKKGTATITAKVGGVKYTCKLTVENPSLSKTKLTLIEGNTFTLKLNGNTQKVKWSSSNTNVATVSGKGVVTAKSEGYTTIYATVGYKNYSCSLTVNKPPVDMRLVHATYYDLGDGIAAVIHNDFNECLRVTATALYYDTNKRMIDTRQSTCYAVGTGKTVAIKISGPYSSSYDRLDYDSFEIKLTAERSSYKNSDLGNQNIDLKTENTGDKLIITATNTGNTDYSYVQFAVLFFDAYGNCIGYDYNYADCETAGTTDYINVRFPYDSNYNTIVPNSYEVYLNYAY